MASEGSSPAALSRSSSNTSLVSAESDLGDINAYGLRRALQNPNESTRTTKDCAYFDHLYERRNTLNKNISNANEVFAKVFQERLAVETVNDFDLLNELTSKLFNAAKACENAECELDDWTRNANILGALPKMTKQETKVFMLHLDVIEKRDSHHTADVAYIPFGAAHEIFEKVRKHQSDYMKLAMRRNYEHHVHEDEFNQLVKAHSQLDDARREIFELGDELASVKRLCHVMGNAIDAKTDAETNRQTTSLRGLLSRARAETRIHRDERHKLEKTIKDLREKLEEFADADGVIKGVTHENEILKAEQRVWREADWETAYNLAHRPTAVQEPKLGEHRDGMDAMVKETILSGYEVRETALPDGSRRIEVISEHANEQNRLPAHFMNAALNQSNQTQQGGERGNGVSRNDSTGAANETGANQGHEYADADIDPSAGRLTLE